MTEEDLYKARRIAKDVERNFERSKNLYPEIAIKKEDEKDVYHKALYCLYVEHHLRKIHGETHFRKLRIQGITNCLPLLKEYCEGQVV